MKKILIFSLAYYPHVGGAEVAVKEITDRITDLEFHMVTLRFSANDAPEEKIGNVFVHRIGGGGHNILNKFFFQFRAASAAAALHTKEHFDATWAVMAHSVGIAAALFKRSHKDVPYILNLQEGDPTEKIERMMLPVWPLFKKAFTLADMVQPLSTFLAQWARTVGYKGPIELIPNGVNVAHFKGKPIAHEGTVLITTSRLVHKNAVDVVIRALSHIPHVRFQILGIGPDEAALRALAADMKVSDRVEFVGHVDHKNMPSYLHKADIFIRPSRSEGQGASFIEAMGGGLPVIATQEGGLVDFISDKTAWVVRKDHPEDIVAAVRAILANPTATGAVVEAAQRMAEEKYDWDLIARAMRERVFARVL